MTLVKTNQTSAYVARKLSPLTDVLAFENFRRKNRV